MVKKNHEKMNTLPIWTKQQQQKTENENKRKREMVVEDDISLFVSFSVLPL